MAHLLTAASLQKPVGEAPLPPAETSTPKEKAIAEHALSGDFWSYRVSSPRLSCWTLPTLNVKAPQLLPAGF